MNMPDPKEAAELLKKNGPEIEKRFVKWVQDNQRQTGNFADEKEAEAAVKDAIARAGPGGGYVLSDNHGEIPWQVPDEVLMALSEAVHKWGRYPLDWTEGYDT